jgi:NAD+ synthase
MNAPLPVSVSEATVLPESALHIDCASEAARIAASLTQAVAKQLRKRGVVIALSGGVDSSVCAALAVQALGPKRVFGLMLPEQDSSSNSERRARMVAAQFGIECVLQDIAPALQALGCYQWRDEAIRQLFPAYADGWKNKITIAGGDRGAINFFRLVVQSPQGQLFTQRLPIAEYLQIVAATNFKQRVRKMIEYFHADRLNYAVIGTPNRLEYDQGFFVKNGDGAADVKPIAHLYKTQVYALARHFGLPEEICAAQPTTDTYSLHQGQDEFYFALPYQKMDLALWAHNHGYPAAALAATLGMTIEQADFVYRDIEAKRRTTHYLHALPVLMEPVPEVTA